MLTLATKNVDAHLAALLQLPSTIAVLPAEVVSDTELVCHLPELDNSGLYVLRFSVDDGHTWLEDSAFNLYVENTEDVVVAINCGGPAYLSNRGIHYTSHNASSKWLQSGVVLPKDHHWADYDNSPPNLGTVDETLFHTAVSGGSYTDVRPIIYQIPLPTHEGENANTIYQITLKFAEVFYKVSPTCGRYMDISINGDQVESSFAVPVAAGVHYNKNFCKFAAMDKVFSTTKTKGGSNIIRIQISTSNHRNNKEPTPILNAIVITRSNPELALCVEPVYLSSADVTANGNSFLSPVVNTLKFEATNYSDNLVTNGCGESGDLKGWTARGDWVVQNCNILEASSCFVTSYSLCMKEQEISLHDHKFSPSFLAKIPAIHFSEVAKQGSGDCPYVCTVTLLDEGKNIIVTHTTDTTLCNKTETFSHDFKDYGSPCHFSHGGQDGVFWGGNFGTSITLTCVKIDLGSEGREDENDSESSALDTSGTSTDTNRANAVVKGKVLKRREIIHKAREVRFFVSSTFKDFIRERDCFTTKVFPELRAFCDKRNVAFTDIDLRWGVTTEQSSSGQTIRLCLEEIDKCRPYYMCMLGERYGWCQTDLDVSWAASANALLSKTFDTAVHANESFGWINNYRDKSVTELEIRHASLNSIQKPGTLEHSQFYYRNPGNYIEAPGDAESALSKEKMRNLKLDIEAQFTGDRAPKRYDTPEQLGELVLAALTKQIGDDFPIVSKPTAVEAERDAHNTFAVFRARCYLECGSYFADLDAFIASDETVTTPLLIVGDSGSGKSSLLAKWWISREERDWDTSTLIVTHYVGATVDSCSHYFLMRRIMLEITAHLSLPQDVPTENEKILKHFP
eukprot:gene35276-43494_t